MGSKMSGTTEMLTQNKHKKTLGSFINFLLLQMQKLSKQPKHRLDKDVCKLIRQTPHPYHLSSEH